MGAISKKLASRLGKANKQLGKLRRQASTFFAQVPRDANGAEALVRAGRDPLHVAYTAAQNFTSFFAETVSEFPAFGPYARIVGPAEEEYLPAGPPMSPLTMSYFTTWAFFDVRFGADGETMGTCLLDVAPLLELSPLMTQTIQAFQGSRMGIYEHCGAEGGRCRLKELVTDEERTCYVASGYKGKPGELWYVRLCPPLPGFPDYHVAFTTPYVLLGTTKADWTAYLNKSLRGASDPKKALHELLKFGKAARSRRADESWSEFLFQAYSNHQPNVIFLAGLPDVKESLPHAPRS
jgi:hypothetical protein